MSEQPALDIDTITSTMENHAGRLDAEAVTLFDAAETFLRTAQQNYEQTLADAQARADAIMAEARANAAEEKTKGDQKQAEAAYWRNLAKRERHEAEQQAAAMAAGQAASR